MSLRQRTQMQTRSSTENQTPVVPTKTQRYQRMKEALKSQVTTANAIAKLNRKREEKRL